MNSGSDLDHLAATLRRTRDELRLQIHLLRLDAEDGAHELVDALERVAERLEGARAAPDVARATLPLEAARLKAALAAMDARDALDDARSHGAHELHHLRRRAHDGLVELERRLEPLARLGATYT